MVVKLLILSVFVAFASVLITQNFNYVINYLFSYGNSKTKLFSKEELNKYDGGIQPDLYLAIVGNVYNVSKGRSYYGPGQTYHIFIGSYNCFTQVLVYC